jgi:hypothetical protein
VSVLARLERDRALFYLTRRRRISGALRSLYGRMNNQPEPPSHRMHMLFPSQPVAEHHRHSAQSFSPIAL